MLCGSAAWGAALTLFGLPPSAWAGLAFLVVAGAADTVAVVSRTTAVQTRTPRELLGRVSAAGQIVGRAGPDIGNMRGGLVAEAASGPAALVVGGLLCLAVVLLLASTTPALRNPTVRPGGSCRRRLRCMHSTFTDHARCLHGDEYRPAPPCNRGHHEQSFVEELTFADADTIFAVLREPSPQLVDGLLPVRVRNLSYRLVLLQRPDEPALLREAAQNLWLHGPDRDDIAAELTRRAEALDAG